MAESLEFVTGFEHRQQTRVDTCRSLSGASTSEAPDVPRSPASSMRPSIDHLQSKALSPGQDSATPLLTSSEGTLA